MMAKEGKAIEMERNWADLSSELCLLILKKLPDISDFVRTRAVCKPWRFSSSISDLPPQFPWILWVDDEPNIEFYSIAFNKVYTDRTCCSSGSSGISLLGGTAGSYWLTGHGGNADSLFLYLQNPLNNSKVPLPVIPDINLSEMFNWFNPPRYQIDEYMLFYEYERSLLCKPGDDRWDIIGPGHEFKYSCYYLKGLHFRVEYNTGVTKVMDISSHKELYVIPPPKYEKLSNSSMSCGGPYLVESYGEILIICYNQSYQGADYKFYIHRLEFGNGKGNPYWVKLSSIGDRILFIEIPLGQGRCLCIKASDFAGFKGNCIYYITAVPAFHSHVHVINVYDIENGETIFIDTPFNRKNYISWFMPSLNHL